MRHLIGLIFTVFLFVTPQAAEWQWQADLTEPSSPEYAALLEKLNAPGLVSEMGIPVSNLHWRAEAIDVHLQSGAIFPENNIHGVSLGAFFEGEATVTIVFNDRVARDKMQLTLSRESLEAVPIT
jgi:hypothetical protein